MNSSMKFKKKCFCMKLGGPFDLGAPEIYVHPSYYVWCQLMAFIL